MITSHENDLLNHETNHSFGRIGTEKVSTSFAGKAVGKS